MKIKQILITLLILSGVVNADAQLRSALTDSAKNSGVWEKIGLDMTVPDFETKNISQKFYTEQWYNDRILAPDKTNTIFKQWT